MADTPTHVTSLLAGLLRGERGLSDTVADLKLDDVVSPLDGDSIVELQASAELTEKTSSVRYPAVHVYCDRIQNTLKEKFRSFSGVADLNIEVRVTHDHLGSLQTQLRTYVQAVTKVLEQNRGSWDAGTWYPGTYEVTFSPVKRGGRNFLQSARISFQVTVQAD